MAEPADINVDELRRRARRRLVGAVVLALGVAVVVPMLLETDQKPLGDDVSVKIPPVDSGKFVNRLNEPPAKSEVAANADDAMKGPAGATTAPNDAAMRPQKYDTRVPESATGSATPPASSVPPAAPTGAATSGQPGVAQSESSAAEHAGEPAAATESAGAKSPASESTRTVSASAHTTGEPAKPAHTGGDAAKPAHSATAAAQREGFAVQLAAFADDRGANSLAGRLKKAGYAAYTEPLKTSKGTLWRVRVGPYPSREAATAARDKLKTQGQSGIVAAIK